MKSFLQFLTEKIYDIQKEVDAIYDRANIVELISAVQKDFASDEPRFVNFEEYKKKHKLPDEVEKSAKFVFASLDDYHLERDFANEDLKKALKENPITLKVGVFRDGSFYDPRAKYIQVTLNAEVWEMLNNTKGNVKFITGRSYNSFKHEYTEENIKGSIYHELTHWLDDTLHNKQITKKLTKNAESGYGKNYIAGKHASVNHSFIEKNAQIHKIKALKDKISEDEFNNLTWSDFFDRLPSLKSNFAKHRNEKEFIEFAKSFITRLGREGLLPKNMKKLPSWEKIKTGRFD